LHKLSRPSFPQVKVGGFRTASISRRELAQVMVADCFAARENPDWLPKLVFSSNGQGIALAGQNNAFAETMNAADIVHADGMPVVFASKLTAHPLPERIATTDFFHDAAKVATEHGLSFYILGSTRKQNDAAVARIKEIYPNVAIVGQRDGYFSDDESDEVCAEIRAAKPDVLWVALGKPRQEFWCQLNREKLRGVGWIKTCGGLYAFLAGDVPRAPRWMQSAGLEWLFRTLDDPHRLIWRYLTTNPYAMYLLVTRTG
jgi:N-acetylglucosaminyldiphosphoundecaprenol N-acetyl-beta-D-mannosaminyltransferase